MRSAPAIAFEWKRSCVWRASRRAALAAGVACLAWSGLGAWAKLALILLAAWMELRTVRNEDAWHPSRWKLDGDGGWRWRRDGDDPGEGEATLVQATSLGPMILLDLRASGRRVDLALWPDNLDADTRRRLRARLGKEPAIPRERGPK